MHSNQSLSIDDFKKKIQANKRATDDYNQLLTKLKDEFRENYKRKVNCSLAKNDFEYTVTLGHGSFGEIILAKQKSTDKYFAIKVLNKEKLVKKRQLEHILNEKYILQAINFPFVVSMEYSFKDSCNLYLVMPYVPGGDLFSRLSRVKVLPECDAKFYAAQVVLALEYLHNINVIFRDLKPENIVIETDGYIKLIDFGFSKVVKTRTYTLCGTPEYLAPEIILSKGYGKSADWWSFGILVFELIAGHTPFYAKVHMLIYEKIVAGKVKYNSRFSEESKDLLDNILQVDLSKRFGNLRNGVWDIKYHAWFKLIDWQAIFYRTKTPPFIPSLKDAKDTGYFHHSSVVNIQQICANKYEKEFEDF